MFKNVIALQQVARRTIYSSARRQVDNKVPLKQKAFQEDNGMPVHLKGGSADALLYRTTMALTVLGENVCLLSTFIKFTCIFEKGFIENIQGTTVVLIKTEKCIFKQFQC
uniref:Cytochrome c oxidase subunit 7A2, mitochondrial n=1 Tax=Acanthochromis polyacanthus TaxID=80966 RepID=A0A3Q1ECS7_9TELE